MELKKKRIPKPCNRGESKIRIKKIKISYTKQVPTLNTTNIQRSRIDILKKIKFPPKLTPLLAEEIGMHLGDGFLPSSKKEYRLKGHKVDEKDYYLKHVKKIYKKLYGINVNIKDYTDTIGFEFSSLALWNFKVKVLGIKPGKKIDLCVPDIVKINDQPILSSFLRGLFDTDGSVAFIVKYGIKKYYPCISIAQKSPKIINDISEILIMLGFSPKVYHYKDHSTLRLNGFSQLEHYKRTIGWSSTKHLKKVKDREEKYLATVV